MAATRKRKIKQSLKEFRAWLQGVEELQSDEWCPNFDQWKLIRDKIDGIIEEKVVVEKTAVPAPAPAYNNAPPVYNVPAPALPPGFQPPPPVGGFVPTDVEMTPAARQLLDPAANGGKAVTPNIDTSDGNVSSPFE